MTPIAMVFLYCIGCALVASLGGWAVWSVLGGDDERA